MTNRNLISPFVVICLPLYQPKPELLRVQLQSIIEQSHKNWLCLIMSDGDPEAKELAEEIVNGNSRFKILSESQNQGVWFVIEKLLNLSILENPDFIALADQDDYWHPDKLKMQIGEIANSGCGVTSCDTDLRSTDNTLIRSGLRRSSRKGVYGSLLIANEVSGAGLMMTGSFVKSALPFPVIVGRKHHDHFLALLAIRLGELHLSDLKLYDWIQHGSNFSGNRALPIMGKLKLNFNRLKIENSKICVNEMIQYHIAVDEILKLHGIFKDSNLKSELANGLLFSVRKRYLHTDFVIGTLQLVIFLFMSNKLAVFSSKNKRKG